MRREQDDRLSGGEKKEKGDQGAPPNKGAPLE